MNKILRVAIILLLTAIMVVNMISCGIKADSGNEGENEMNVRTYIIYVDNAGNDANDGKTRSTALKTIDAAKNAVIGLQTESIKENYDNIKISICEGTYNLSSTLVLEKEFSSIVPVTISGESGKNINISGAKPISGTWQIYDNGKNIYRIQAGTEDFRELYVNKEKATRARFPNLDKSSVVENSTFSVWGNIPEKESSVLTSDLNGSGVSESDIIGAELIIHNYWGTAMGSITAARTEDGRMYFKLNNNGKLEDIMYEAGFPRPMSKNPIGWFENHLKFIDSTGEWYHNVNDGYLYYKPAADEDIQAILFETPVLEQLVQIKGTGAARVKNITIENITFEGTNWTYPSEFGYIDTQAGLYLKDFKSSPWTTMHYHMPSAVEILYATNINIKGCVIKNAIANGISLRGGARNISITGNVIRNIGGNGISVGYFEEQNHSLDIAPSRYFLNDYASHVTQDIKITNNIIKDIGGILPGCGISGGYAKDIYIEHNEIDNTVYDGIAFGWGWGSSITVNGNFNIKYNKINKALNSHLDDGAAIYMLGKHKAENGLSYITDNYITGKTGCAIYFDDTSSNFIAENNVLDGTNKYGPYHIHDMGHRLENLTIRNIYSLDENRVIEFLAHYVSNGQLISDNARYLNYVYLNSGEISTEAERNVVIQDPVIKTASQDWPQEAYAIKDAAGLTFEYENIRNK